MCMFDPRCEYPSVPNIYHVSSNCCNKVKDIGARKKLEWLRNDFIGEALEFDSPFGKRQVTYADCTATGRCLRYIEDYLIHNVLPFYGNTHTSDSYVGKETTNMVKEATEYIKSCLGAGENDVLICGGSGSTAAIKRLQEVMGVAVPSILRDRMLQILSEEERWVVFVGPHEHHSNYLSWYQSLAEVVEIGINEDGLLDFEELEQQLRFYQSAKRPMLGSFSACSNVTGICLDTRKTARLLHLYGAFACFDFAGSGPYVEIKMRAGENDGYDAIYLSPHKFAGGPGSPGILMMNKVLYQLKSSPPSTCGGGTVNFVNGYTQKDTMYVDDIEERENAGTPPIIQKIRAALALSVKEYIGYEVIKKQDTYFIERALERLLPNPNIWILGNTRAKRHAILSFLVYSSTGCGDQSEGEDDRLYMWRSESGSTRGKPLHGPFIAKLLNDLFGIQARGGCACAGPYAHHLLRIDHRHSLALKSCVDKGFLGVKPGWARINFPYYMSNEKFDFILLAVEFIASFGQRFLPLYNFNWKTGKWRFSKKKFDEVLNKKIVDGTHAKLACDIEELSLDDCEGAGDYNEEIIAAGVPLKQKYEFYLEHAMHIAQLLPSFPSERAVPEDIDPKYVFYKV